MIKIDWEQIESYIKVTLLILEFEAKYEFLRRLIIKMKIKWRTKKIDSMMIKKGISSQNLSKINLYFKNDIKEGFNRKKEIATRKKEIENLLNPEETIRKEEKIRKNYIENILSLYLLFKYDESNRFYNFLDAIIRNYKSRTDKIKDIDLPEIARLQDRFINFKERNEELIDFINLKNEIKELSTIIGDLKKQIKKARSIINEYGWINDKLKEFFDRISRKYLGNAKELNKIQKILGIKNSRRYDFENLFDGFTK